MRPEYTPRFIARFWSKVDMSGECWLWTAGKSKGGYGLIKSGGHQGPMLYAHRVAYELEYGAIPDGFLVCHHCDIRLCVRGAHLFCGTVADNAADMRRKGRGTHGETHPHTTLTDDDVREIRRRFAAGGISQRRLAAEYGVSPDTVSSLVRRKLWAHVI